MSKPAPLAQEYADATETKLDKSKPQRLPQSDKPQRRAAADDRRLPDQAQEEHPISVGTP